MITFCYQEPELLSWCSGWELVWPEESGFKCWQSQEIFSVKSVQTSFGTHYTSYSMDNGISFVWGGHLGMKPFGAKVKSA